MNTNKVSDFTDIDFEILDTPQSIRVYYELTPEHLPNFTGFALLSKAKSGGYADLTEIIKQDRNLFHQIIVAVTAKWLQAYYDEQSPANG